jgi:hypothetical protein
MISLIRKLSWVTVLSAASWTVFAVCETGASQTLLAPPAATRTAQGGVWWFRGSVEAALEEARLEHKPVLVYWGAKWCPPCNYVKAYVFTRRDFIERTRLFVPVYLDGDDRAAQAWGDAFKATGYPTILVLRADQTELARLVGSSDPAKYALVLDAALKATRPIKDVVSAVEHSAGVLSLTDCKRLAYSTWVIDDAPDVDPDEGLQGDPERAAGACPASARVERERLLIWATKKALWSEKPALLSGQNPSPALSRLIRAQNIVLSDPTLERALDDILNPDETYFLAAERAGVTTDAKLREWWINRLESREHDRGLVEADRLQALARRLRLIKSRDGRIPAALANEAVHRAEVALARTQEASARVSVADILVYILKQVGRTDRTFAVLESESARPATAFHFLSELASAEEARGNSAKALVWRQRAYKVSQGPATRFQAGVDYVTSLTRAPGQSEETIRQAALDVLAELDGPDRMYARTRARLAELGTALIPWDVDGQHARVITAIRERMKEICNKAGNDNAAALSACERFLAQEAHS